MDIVGVAQLALTLSADVPILPLGRAMTALVAHKPPAACTLTWVKRQSRASGAGQRIEGCFCIWSRVELEELRVEVC